MPTTSTSTTTTISTSTSTTSTSTSTTSTSTTTTYLPYPDLKDSPVGLDLYPVSTAALPGAGNIIETTLSAGITIANPGVAATLQLTSTTNFPIYGFVVIQHNSTFEIVRYEGLDAAPVGVVVKERGYGSTSAMAADSGDKVWLVDASYYSDLKSAYLVRLMIEHNADGGHAAMTVSGNIVQANALNIQTDEIRARDGDGLKLYDDGGNGIFVKDGGDVGIGLMPSSKLEIKSSGTSTNPIRIINSADTDPIFQVREDGGGDGQMNFFDAAAVSKVQLHTDGHTYFIGGNVGAGTIAPGQILDCNDGSGNMIADGYDNHPSYLANKVDPVPMNDVLTKFKQVIPYEYKRIPYVSAEELARAGREEFGQEKWEAAFLDGYRDGKLKDCPDEEIKAFLDNLADELRAERQEWPEYQRLHYSLALDDLADTFPDILSRNKDGDVTGYSLNNYVGLLHACITGLIERVEQLEIRR